MGTACGIAHTTGMVSVWTVDSFNNFRFGSKIPFEPTVIVRGTADVNHSPFKSLQRGFSPLAGYR